MFLISVVSCVELSGICPSFSAGHPDLLKLFRERVSRAAAGKARAVLEGVGLKAAQITACFRDHPLDEEEGIQTGLIKWSGGQGHQPPTWAVLLNAMSYAKVAQEYIQGLETDLGLHSRYGTLCHWPQYSVTWWCVRLQTCCMLHISCIHGPLPGTQSQSVHC